MRWLFGLAERLHMTVGTMLAAMSSSELTYWLAYDRVKDQPVQRQQTPEQLAAKLRAIFGGKKR